MESTFFMMKHVPTGQGPTPSKLASVLVSPPLKRLSPATSISTNTNNLLHHRRPFNAPIPASTTSRPDHNLCDSHTSNHHSFLLSAARAQRRLKFPHEDGNAAL